MQAQKNYDESVANYDRLLKMLEVNKESGIAERISNDLESAGKKLLKAGDNLRELQESAIFQPVVPITLEKAVVPLGLSVVSKPTSVEVVKPLENQGDLVGSVWSELRAGGAGVLLKVEPTKGTGISATLMSQRYQNMLNNQKRHEELKNFQQ